MLVSVVLLLLVLLLVVLVVLLLLALLLLLLLSSTEARLQQITFQCICCQCVIRDVNVIQVLLCELRCET